MAIFKIMPAVATFSAVEYNEKKEKQDKGEKIHFENFDFLTHKPDLKKSEIEAFLNAWSNTNKNVKKKQFHAVLSAKGKVESFEALKIKALKMMDKLGYGGNPILIYAHRDTKNNHVHIVTSRVDSNGKKINDSHEHTRSMVALREIENVNSQKQFEQLASKYLEYSFTNQNQFNLLLEHNGFKPNQNSNFQTEYYKYDELQGMIECSKIESAIDAINPKQFKERATQIRAVISKYAKLHDQTLKLTNGANVTDAKPKFDSKLTGYLKEKHGLEFVFFGKLGKSDPYGYMVIDHAKKNVYKGSEIMKLTQLRGIAPLDPIKAQKSIAASDKHFKSFGQKVHDGENGIDQNQINIDNVFTQAQSSNEEGKKGLKSQDILPTRKRKKKNNQR